MAEDNEIIELLKRVRLFQGLTDEDLEIVSELVQQKRFRKGSVIFEQGNAGDSLYIIESGRVKAAIKDEEGREKILGVFGQGDYFGEMALLSDQPRSATMTVVGDAELLELSKESFERFLASNVNVMRQFVGLMSRRLAETSAMAVRDSGAEEKAVLGKCIAFFSPKGGVGKTTLAVNMATLLQEQTHKSVVIVDCSYPFGDVGIMLNLEPKRTIIDLLPHVNELGGEIIESILQPHASGVKVLLAPASPEETELVTAEHVGIIISALRELYEYIIVDTHPSFTDVSIGVLDAADLILVPTTLELPALKNVRQFIETATQKLGYTPEKIAIIVNRASPVGGLRIADVEASTGGKVVATVVSNGLVAVNAANQGVPFVISNKESQLYKDTLALVKLIAPQAIQEEEEGYSEEEEEEAQTLPERIRTVPVRIRAAVSDELSRFNTSDFLLGLGSLFVASAPFMLLFALLGFIARAMNVTFPASPAFNLAIWIGIVGGTVLVDRLQEPRKNLWVVGALLGASYGLILSFAAIAVGNAAGATLNTHFLMVFFNLIPYAILGIIGSIVAQRTRPQTQALLT